MTDSPARAATDRDAPATLPITLTVATVQGWPEISAAFETWRAAAQAAGGEVIVADGSGRSAPDERIVGPLVRWDSHPGESIFQLRLRTYRAARGAIIAVTEDHVHVPPDWATRMIDVHDRHPEAAAIGGSVSNGATDSILDWASFFIVQAPVAAPVPTGPAKRLSGAVNVSYKRAAIESPDTFEGMGAIDVLHQRDLKRKGAKLLNDDSIRVVHVQPLSFGGVTAINFHAGRTISGFRRKRLTAVDVARIAAAPVVPFLRYARTVAILAPKGYAGLLLRATPGILWLLIVQGVGQFIGYVAGEGDSPRHVM
jgi:hypothetical protein